MAFAVSNTKLTVTGGIRVYSGKWTGAAGDAAGSIDIGSAEVISADFDPNKASGGPTEKPLVSRSVSGSTTTLSVYNKDTVTDGKFKIEY